METHETIFLQLVLHDGTVWGGGGGFLGGCQQDCIFTL